MQKTAYEMRISDWRSAVCCCYLLSWPCPPAFARIQRRIARGAIEGDACLDPIENECVALGPGDANVGLGIDFKIDCAAVAKFAVDDRAGAIPAEIGRAHV